MSFDPYCRLFLHADVSHSELMSHCRSLLGGFASGRRLTTPLLDVYLKESENFDEERFKVEKRFVFARYTAEVDARCTPEQLSTRYTTGSDTRYTADPDPVEPDVDENAFVDCVCQLISGLRRLGVLVVASCDFEEKVIEKTGWNWTFSSREHPPVGP